MHLIQLKMCDLLSKISQNWLKCIHPSVAYSSQLNWTTAIITLSLIVSKFNNNIYTCFLLPSSSARGHNNRTATARPVALINQINFTIQRHLMYLCQVSPILLQSTTSPPVSQYAPYHRQRSINSVPSGAVVLPSSSFFVEPANRRLIANNNSNNDSGVSRGWTPTINRHVLNLVRNVCTLRPRRSHRVLAL